MSSDDEERFRAWQLKLRKAFAAKVAERIRTDNAAITPYVQAGSIYVSNEDVKRLIGASNGKIIETLPHHDGREQYKIEIQYKYRDALFEGWPAIEISDKPFKAPSALNPLKAQMRKDF